MIIDMVGPYDWTKKREQRVASRRMRSVLLGNVRSAAIRRTAAGSEPTRKPLDS